MKEAAGWLTERLAAERDRFFRLGPAPLAPQPERKLAPQEPERSRRCCGCSRRAAERLARAHGASLPAGLAVRRALPRAAGAADADRLRARRWPGCRASRSRSRSSPCSSLRRSDEVAIEQAAPFAPIRISRPDVERRRVVDRPLRLITASPVDQLARTIEALLVVASQPLTVGGARRGGGGRARARRDGARAARASATARGGAGSCSSRSRAVGPSAPRARRRRRAAGCSSGPSSGRCRRRRSRRSRSSRTSGRARAPTIARIRGVSRRLGGGEPRRARADLRGGPRDGAGGAIRYRTTPLFERVFGLESLVGAAAAGRSRRRRRRDPRPARAVAESRPA